MKPNNRTPMTGVGFFLLLIAFLATPAMAGTSFEGAYYLLNVHSDKALDVENVSSSDGANVHQWDYGNGANQQWVFESAPNGAWYLRSQHSRLYLDVAGGSSANGANIQQANFNGSPAQQFRAVERSPGVYRLENVGSGRVLDAAGWSQANGGNIVQWDSTGGENQQWQIIPVGAATDLSGTYRLESVHSGKVLDVAGGSQDPAANVQQWQDAGNANQQWRLLSAGPGYYKLQAVHSGQMLDVANADTSNGANLQQHPDNGNDAQRFALIGAGDGQYRLRNKHSGKVVDVAGWSADDGGNIHQWTNHGQANQTWRLLPADGGGDGGDDGDTCQAEPVWAEEFNYTGLPDSSKWSFEVQDPGWVNNEWQNYTGHRPENARVEDGRLIIEARRDWYQGHEISSARIKTHGKGDWLNGRIVVRAKMPQGRGTWPAIWMMPSDSVYGGWPDSGEIDIMEHVGYAPEEIHGSTHSNGRNHMLGNNFQVTTHDASVEHEFHTYAIDWNQQRIQFLMDGEPYGTYENAGEGWTTWPFDQEFHLILNLAIGGMWGGANGVDMSLFPARMEVDWVRVYQPGACSQ